MQDSTLLIVAMVCIMIMEVVAMVALHLDGVYLSAAVAAISSIAVRQYTKTRCENGWSQPTRRSFNRRIVTPSSGLRK